jgi:hypothetical protein
MRNFAALILTHGKPNKVDTYRALRNHGYTGRVIFILDDGDSTLPEYQRLFPNDELEIFSKSDTVKTFDIGDNFNEHKCVVIARNAIFPIARRLGLTHFVELDDDYSSFRYAFDPDGNFGHAKVKNLDRIFELYCDFLDRTSSLTVAMSQGGDFIGGENGTLAKQMYPWRKCMNTFFCRTDRPFTFLGRLNEDVNTYVGLGREGKLLFTLPNIMTDQAPTQAAGNGMTEMYSKYGTYVKSFYTVMRNPSCTKIVEIGVSARRIHHQIKWKQAYPCILAQQFKKHVQQVS